MERHEISALELWLDAAHLSLREPQQAPRLPLGMLALQHRCHDLQPILRRESGEPDEVLESYYGNLYAHRTRWGPGVRLDVRLDGDRALVDAARYVEHLRFMRDELGAERFNIPSLWISHRGIHTMPPDAQWMRRPIFADAELTRLRPEFEKPFRSYMRQLVDLLQAEGLLLAPVVRFFDEPHLDDRPTVNGLRTLSPLMLDIEPGLTVSIAACYPHPEFTEVIRLWVLHTDAWYRRYEDIQAARAAGCRVYVYNNAVNFPEHRPIRVRLWPWRTPSRR